MQEKNFWSIDYIDSLMIVDKHFTILHASRYNPRFGDLNFENNYSEYDNKNYFEVYPKLDENESTMVECIKKGRVVYRNNQIFRDSKDRVFNTYNITIPIKRCGKIIGAIELSKDITSINDLEKETSDKMISRQLISDFTEYEKIMFEDIHTLNVDMIENIRKAKVFVNSSNPTLIYGETGTGKELFVQAMVNLSSCPREKFVALNCAAVPANLIESTLFGSVKGAYTGAENKIGLFELADGGILFLDELNSMPYETQAKLLRVLQDNRIRPVGSNKEKKVIVKVIAAMNMNPMVAIEKKYLREDLFYRLSSSMIKLIPLRERKEDILLYVNYFINIFNQRFDKKVEGLSRTMLDLFMNCKWKGNVRELKHVIENMISTSEEKILTIKSLPIYMKDNIGLNEKKQLPNKNEKIMYEPMANLREILERTERTAISRALTLTKGHITKAAEILDIPRQTLKYKMNKLNINQNLFKKR